MSTFSFGCHPLTSYAEREREEEVMLELIEKVYESQMRKAPPPRDNPSVDNVKTKPPVPSPVIETRPRRKNSELGRAIMDTLFHAGGSGMGLRRIALEINSKPSSVSNWIYNNRNHVS